MNYRMQLSPTSGSRETVASVHVSEPRDTVPPSDWERAKLFRSWLIYDSDLELNRSCGPMNWNMLLGVVLAAAISASFWTGIAVLIARLWK